MSLKNSNAAKKVRLKLKEWSGGSMGARFLVATAVTSVFFYLLNRETCCLSQTA